MALFILIAIISLVVLLWASDLFVESAEKIGLSMGVSPFIIGVTIVAFGTSLPELAASIAAVLSGTSEIVVGNAIGSNITNILLVLGLTALVGKELRLDFDLWDIDMPMLFGSAFLLFFTLRDGALSTGEAILYLLALIIFLLHSVRGTTSEPNDEKIEIVAMDYIKMLAGGILVFIGAKYTIYGIEGFSHAAGISPEIISLTFIALGTSLPEVVVSISAAKKGKHAIAVGNVLGSNIFNSYAVLAIPSFIAPLTIPAGIISSSLPFMVAVTIMFGVMVFSRRICKWEGCLLLIFYGYFLLEQFKMII